MKPISQILPELYAICHELGLEKKVCAYRNCPPREHGLLRAYEIWKVRNGIKTPEKRNYTLALATTALNKTQKLS